MIGESGDNILAAILRHHVVKTGEGTVGHPAALVKAVDDAVGDVTRTIVVRVKRRGEQEAGEREMTILALTPKQAGRSG